MKQTTWSLTAGREAVSSLGGRRPHPSGLMAEGQPVCTEKPSPHFSVMLDTTVRPSKPTSTGTEGQRVGENSSTYKQDNLQGRAPKARGVDSGGDGEEGGVKGRAGLNRGGTDAVLFQGLQPGTHG